ncbi:hypothetical protein [Nocardioides sp.]|uniref:hypothetical protein n=1 Tax=Nocardioides sp. TaxID=35761 RepID=UPI0019C824F6|nr:hypothetical protein [Nocardioides sp.]MBC7278768.1 hypothetical protein [Nocardioides sp.]
MTSTHNSSDKSKPKTRLAAYVVPVVALMLAPTLALTLAGCGSEATDPGANVSTVSSSSNPASAEDPNVAAAIADLAERQGIDTEEITVVSNEEVTWRDGSLGCPEPGKMYSMALVDGVRVVLEAAGKTYAYHGGKSGTVRFCENPQEPVPSEGSSDAPQ